MTTRFKQALDWFESVIRTNPCVTGKEQQAEAIRAALMMADAVESGDANLHPLGSDRPKGEIEAWNTAIEHLKKIRDTHDTNR